MTTTMATSMSENLLKLITRKKMFLTFLIVFVSVLTLRVWAYITYHKHYNQYSINNRHINVTILILVLFVTLLCLYLRETYNYWSKLGVPCTKPFPVVGHTLRLLGISMHIIEFYDDLYYKHNGKDFCGFYEFLKPGLVVGDLELIKNITLKNFDHFANRRVFSMAKVNPIANEMLSNATGENWRRIRSAISPLFTSYKLKQLYPLICQQGNEFVKLLGKIGKDKKELEMRQICGQFSMDCIASCAFGIECQAMNSDRAEFAKMATKIFILSPIRALKIIIIMTAPFLAHWVQLLGIDFTSEEFHFFHKVVAKTLRFREENGIRRGDFLDLMKDTNKLSETTMTAQAVLFLLAGQNNIASSLSFTLHLLAMNPEIQEELRKELLNANKNGEGLDSEAILKLALLDGVVKESLRLYPADPNLERVCTKDYQIPGTNILIRKGQPVVIPIWSIHRDPAYWPDPEIFKPQRFLHVTDRDFGPYLPFGVGPRQCIGLKFVYSVIKVGLNKILCKYRIVPSINTVHPPPLSPRSFLSLQPLRGLPLAIVPLEGSS